MSAKGAHASGNQPLPLVESVMHWLHPAHVIPRGFEKTRVRPLQHLGRKLSDTESHNEEPKLSPLRCVPIGRWPQGQCEDAPRPSLLELC